MSMALDPRERLWREANSELIAQVIARLAPDMAAPSDYAEILGLAARLCAEEAEAAGKPVDLTPPAVATEAEEHPYGINPETLYTAPDAAPLIGIQCVNTLYTMARRPHGPMATRTGPKHGITLFRGRDLIAYLEGKQKNKAA